MQPALRVVSSNGLDLALRVTDPDVLAELSKLAEPAEREAFALAALRIGVLAIRQAGGALDERAVRDAGKEMVAQFDRTMAEHRLETISKVKEELKAYFDKSSGKVPAMMEELTRSGGSVDRMLKQHLAGDASTLAHTLTQHVGQQSPLLQMLSPEQKSGLLSRVEELVKKNLEEQRSTLLGEFDLNREQSALSRLVKQMKDGQGTLERNFADTIGKLASEWSLDNKDSSVSRFKGDVAATLEKMIAGQASFQKEVAVQLAALQARREVEEVTPRKGANFEEALGQALQAEAQRAREIYHPVGLLIGELNNCRVGDFVLEFGPESAAPGQRIVVEAKFKAECSLKAALEELAVARPNRKAQVGVFVFAKSIAPAGLARFQRHGNDVVIVWDAEDPSTDLWLVAALEVARALIVRGSRESAANAESLGELDTAIAQVEKDSAILAEIGKWADSIGVSASKIRHESDNLAKKIARRIADMKDGVETLKGGASKP